MVANFLIGVVFGVIVGFISSVFMLEIGPLISRALRMCKGSIQRRRRKKWDVFRQNEDQETRIPLFNWRGATVGWVCIEDAPLHKPLIREMFEARQAYWVRKLGLALRPFGCFVNYDAKSPSKDFIIDVGWEVGRRWKRIPILSEDWPGIARDPAGWLTKQGVIQPDADNG